MFKNLPTSNRIKSNKFSPFLKAAMWRKVKMKVMELQRSQTEAIELDSITARGTGNNGASKGAVDLERAQTAPIEFEMGNTGVVESERSGAGTFGGQNQLASEPPCDIPGFINYILHKEKHKQATEQVNDDKEIRVKELRVCRQQELMITKQAAFQLRATQSRVLQATIEECSTCDSEMRAVQKMIDEAEAELRTVSAHSTQLECLEEAFAVRKHEIISFEQEKLKAIEEVQRHRLHLQSQIDSLKLRNELLTNKQKQITELKQQIEVMQKVNRSSKLLYQELVKETSRRLRPASHGEHWISQLRTSLCKTMGQIKAGIQENDSFEAFTKSVKVNLEQDEKFRELNRPAQDDPKQFEHEFLASTYADYLGADKYIQSIRIDEAHLTKEITSSCQSQQIEEIKQKNSEVLLYLKKLEAELKLKDTIINDLRAQLPSRNSAHL